MKDFRVFFPLIVLAGAVYFLVSPTAKPSAAQETPQKPAEKTAEKTPDKAQEKPDAKPTPKLPAEIELLETKVRFETDGSSRKEVHARVKINDELGARQFARLNFNFNRAFEQVDIPLVRITHASGGTVDVLPSAVSDNPSAAVVNAPAYQDVRVKSVRILGLEPGDSLEYRVITSVSHHPLAPDFWFDHAFDRTGVVSREIFDLDLPASTKTVPKINPDTPPESSSPEQTGNGARVIYHWDRKQPAHTALVENSEPGVPDVTLSTFQSWDQLAGRLAKLLAPTREEAAAAHRKAVTIPDFASVDGELQACYEFVSKKIRTVDLPLGATGYKRRNPVEVFDSGYGSAEDKFGLFAAMLGWAEAGLVPESNRTLSDEPASPARFIHLLTGHFQVGRYYWLDLNLEVAPLGMIPPQFRNKPILVVKKDGTSDWETAGNPRIYDQLYKSSQAVKVNASIEADGKLTAKIKYTMRGDNELLLRVAFHQSPREKWNEVAQLLALSDGFRGKISNTNASDAYETRDPFAVEFEIAQPKFLDWSKKPLRVPAILPLLGLPDPPAKAKPGETAPPIELGTPLDVEVSATVGLPDGTGAEVPAGTSLQRDFATYESHYSVSNGTLTASRRINFILRTIPADRAAEYIAFLRTVQNDESQVFLLERAATK